MNTPKPYDYLIIGADLFGAVFAREAHKAGKQCLMVDKRPQRGGNLYCEDVDGTVAVVLEIERKIFRQ